MRNSTKMQMEKVKKALTDRDYTNMHELCRLTKLKAGSIYRIMKLMNENGVGVYSTRQGYILAEYAKMTDDVHFLRKINGIHTGNVARMNAAIAHLKNRWKTPEQRRMLMEMVRPTTTAGSLLEGADKALIKTSNSLGV